MMSGDGQETIGGRRTPGSGRVVVRRRGTVFPGLQHGSDKLPGSKEFITASKQCRVTTHDVQQQPFVGARQDVWEVVFVVEVHDDRFYLILHSRPLC